MRNPPIKLFISLIVTCLVLLFVAFGFGTNESNTVTIIRSPIATSDNDQRIITESTWYWTVPVLSKVVEYPKFFEAEYSFAATEKSPTNESIRVTFNDAAYADLDTMVAFQLPLERNKLLEFNQRFGGNIDAVELAVWSHLSNAIKSTGPIMSSSEHQSARKGEFNQIVQEQLEKGLFETRKKETVALDQTDETGKPITVFTTEIVMGEDGKPSILRSSPITDLGMRVAQFSITKSEYDPATQKSFTIKKDSFLAIENAKTAREREVQKRLEVQEQGLREKAEVEAKSNMEKAEATIKATKEKEVAETEASKILAVSKLSKETAETKAKEMLEVSKLNRQAAEEDAAAIKIRAEAEKIKIEQAGALTEEKRATLDAEVAKAKAIAEGIGKMNVPGVIINGGNGGTTENGQAQTLQDNLIQLLLLRQNGLVK